MLSIDVSNTGLNLLEGEYKGGKVIVKGAGFVPLREGVVKNGLIVGMAELVEALREGVRKYGFKSRDAALTVNSTTIVTREVTVPEVKPKEMHALLSGEVEQASPQKQESLLDYVVLERMKQEGASVCRALCFVVPRVLVEGYRELAVKAGLKPKSLDVLPHAMYKLICRDERFQSGEGVIIANLREDELCLTLCEGETRIYFRTMPLNAGKDVVENEFILSAFGGNDQFSEAAKQDRLITAASENITKFTKFQWIKNREKPVQKVYLCGELSGGKELEARIGENTGLTAGLLTRPSFVKAPDDLEYERYIHAVSALLTV